MALSLPCHGVHEEEVIIRGAGVLAVVHVFPLSGILHVFYNQLHLFSQVGFRLKERKYFLSEFLEANKNNWKLRITCEH